MNFEFYIAKRIATAKGNKNSISSSIIKIAIVAIAISLVMMLVAIATGFGLQNKIREKVAAFNGHIQIFNYDANQSDVSVNPVSIHQDFYPNFTQIPNVKHIQAVAGKGGIIRTEETFEGIIAKGVGQDYDWKYMQDFLVEGTLPDYSAGRNEDILMSRYMANRLEVGVDDEVNAFFLKNDGSDIPNQMKLHIVGLYDSNFQDFDASYILMDIRHIQRMNKWNEDEVGGFEVLVNDFDEIQETANEIYNMTPSTLNSQSILEKYPFIFEWISYFDFNVILIIGIMILVGGINMITALLVLVLERTPMIGTLKAMGNTSWSIRKIFLYNAAYLISIGIFWGNFIGIGLLLLQQKFGFVKLDATNYYVTQAPVYLNPIQIIILNVGVLLVCTLMLILPSFIITRISPVKAMKFN
ncbi:lipoprotein-releasing system permease protein [Pustulibacterium marinum]|uniref:Lipoprotein-releasing system permease protein n=1 Tax=Pustulibacterium marinum TaxID=1224947 RepID=A0A1I7F8M4_9FLAO|nr:FtsX-like permease family protein [Pustulibacterium marinum]SFU32479.1 lipoprotein-releasing system permease protein [Pustulibacterium marinum]